MTTMALPAPVAPLLSLPEPSSTTTDTPSTACTPPKWRRTSSRRSSTHSRFRPPGRPHQGEPAAADDALRSEHDDGDEEDAGEDVDVVAGALEDVWKQRDDERSDHRAEHEAAPAQDRERQYLHSARHAVLCVTRIDVEEEVSLQRAGVTGHQRAEDEGDHLVARDVDALAQGRQLVLPDRRPSVAQTALGQAPDDEDDDDERDQDEVDRSQRISAPRVAQAETLAGDGHVEDDAETERLDEADRRNRQEHTAQTEHRQADEKTDHAGEEGCSDRADHTWRVPVVAHQHRHIGADCHESRRGERQLT